MNRTFLEVAALARNQLAPPPTERQRVTRLYRNSLRLLMSWAVDRDVFLNEAEKLRARFDAYRGDFSSRAKGALEAGEREFASMAHPDGYVQPYMPGGSKFMRNPPPPMEMVYYEHGHVHVPEEATTGTNTPQWPDHVPNT